MVGDNDGERVREHFFAAPFAGEVADLLFALFLGDRSFLCCVGEGGLSEAEVAD